MGGGIDTGYDPDEIENKDDGPSIECDYEYECQCAKDGVCGEWEWKDQSWVCTGCGEIQ